MGVWASRRVLRRPPVSPWRSRGRLGPGALFWQHPQNAEDGRMGAPHRWSGRRGKLCRDKRPTPNGR
eukprot:3105029-Pyramimonas_sp.AAC.1